jgi:hypothetical protein
MAFAIASAFLWQSRMEAERMQLEKSQIIAKQEETRRAQEVAERREREKLRLKQEIQAQKDVEETQSKIANDARQAEMKSKQFVADERYLTPNQARVNSFYETVDAYQRHFNEQRQRYEDASNLRRAQAEVDRQKRYLEQRDFEERYARLERDFKTKYGR